MPQTLAIVLCLLYATVLACYVLRFRGSISQDSPITRAALAVTIVTHAAFLLFWIHGPAGPAVAPAAIGLSVLALGLAVAYFLIEWITRERNMGLWVMGLPLVFQIISALQMAFASPGEELPETPLLGIHIVTALIGYSAFSLSAAFSVMYLVLYHELKIHRLGLLFERLPSLGKLESMGYRAVQFGLGFLLVSVVLGEMIFFQEEGRIVLTDPKILVALLSCIVYGLTILTRRRLAIRGKRFAQTSIAGFVVILFSLLVVDSLLGGFHQF